MKIVFNNETKRVSDQQTFPQLLTSVTSAFELKEMIQKFFYTDEDGDSITVNTQSDLDLALKESLGKLKLFVAKDSFEAAEQIRESI